MKSLLPVKMTSPNPWNVDDPVKHEAPPPISSPINFFCVPHPSCANLLKRSRFQPNAGNCSKPKTHRSHWPHLSRCISGRTGAEAPGLGFRAAREIQNEEPRQKSGGPDLQFLAKFNFNNAELFFHWTHQNILTIDCEGAEATGHPGFPNDRSPRVMATRDHPNPA